MLSSVLVVVKLKVSFCSGYYVFYCHVDWDRGFGGFLGLCENEKVFFITAMPGGRSYPLQVDFFYCRVDVFGQLYLSPVCFIVSLVYR